ncbi:MAG TPA: cation-translocating P-type ATPase [Chloroflexota bacterium]|jgi:Ca2+-transporting ATPase|nr:cation-translocating P-type ATPase [Chloroflexota bacterium]
MARAPVATLPEIDLRAYRGLSREEAARRLAAEGYNELPATRPRSLWALALTVLREPMILLLLAAGTLYVLLGDLAEAVLLLASIGLIVGINLYQEWRTERALAALRALSSPRALVIRDGEPLRIPGREVVRGDIIVVAEGDRVPADAVVLACVNLAVDESLLTGESVPVRKRPGRPGLVPALPGGDDQPFVYSSTLVVSGLGVAEVQAVGAQTAVGRIGKALQTLSPEPTRLQRETRQLVQVLALMALLLCAVVAGGYGLTHADWVGGLLAGITLGMALIPEEFPVVLAVFLALGAWRLARHHVLTRQAPAIEMLGAATVLCVDKTGTLTLNQMAVCRLFARGVVYEVGDTAPPLPEPFHEVLEFAVLASQRDPFDPMERALKALAEQSLAHTEHLHHDWILVREYPLSPELLALSHVWRSPEGGDYVVAAKGAPEAIFDLCHLDAATTAALAQQVEAMAADGLRVLGVAKARFRAPELPRMQHDFAFEFVGLVGLVDPVRPTVPAAIQECYAAGIRVVMITGDHPRTAQHIARAIGLQPLDAVLTGPELDQLSDDALRQRLRHVAICARVTPEQKLRLVNALRANGEIVAMTGDGVNDAPALKAAHIGIAMGGRGTDVAREAADLVLLDDDFSSIVEAVRLGRGIYDHLQKAMAYLLGVHTPIAGIALLPVLLRAPLVLLPAHIVFLELIIDPACSIVFEAEPIRDDVMKRPPRGVHERLFSARTLGMGWLQGGIAWVVVALVYLLTLYRGQPEAAARAMTFTTLIAANLGLILTNRSWAEPILATLRVPNPTLWWIVGGALVGLGLVLYVPFLCELFSFAPLPLDDLLLCLGVGLSSVLWFEGAKWIQARRRAARPGQPGGPAGAGGEGGDSSRYSAPAWSS